MVAAARQLFAERGVDNVSLREVARQAGQRNTNAVQYHFGNRETLVAAVLDDFSPRVAARRDALLDQLDEMRGAGGDGEIAVRDLAGALVRPSAAMLEDPAGRQYLQVVAELMKEPANLRPPGPLASQGLARWDTLARSCMPDATLPLHRRFSAMQLAASELGRRAASRRRRDHRLFVSDLVDLVTGVLSAEVSEETLRLLAERDG